MRRLFFRYAISFSILSFIFWSSLFWWEHQILKRQPYTEVGLLGVLDLGAILVASFLSEFISVACPPCLQTTSRIPGYALMQISSLVFWNFVALAFSVLHYHFRRWKIKRPENSRFADKD
jgi:hypothetical protein